VVCRGAIYRDSLGVSTEACLEAEYADSLTFWPGLLLSIGNVWQSAERK
jgi:hypothetical protein